MSGLMYSCSQSCLLSFQYTDSALGTAKSQSVLQCSAVLALSGQASILSAVVKHYQKQQKSLGDPTLKGSFPTPPKQVSLGFASTC